MELKSSQSFPAKRYNLKSAEYWWEFASIFVCTFVTIVTFIVNGISSIPEAGFQNGTGEISDEFYTQVTPAGYTFSIWGVIYTWQALWLCYSWSFVFRPSAGRTIFVGVYWAYALANCCNITWIYLWGNKFVQVALPLLVFINLFLYLAIGLLWVYFSRATRGGQGISRTDYWLTWFLPVNGIMFYATWTTIASFINLSATLGYYTQPPFGQENSGTVSLVLLTVTVITYFVLENTIFDRFTRYVFAVYPVVIWALAGVLAAHWVNDGRGRNAIYTLVLLLVVVLHAIARVVLVVLFIKFRPLPAPLKYVTV